MGWFDGNPAHLWEHPPEAAGRRYVEVIGGPDAVLAPRRRAFDDGRLPLGRRARRHLVFADPTHTEARELQAAALEQLGYGAENGTWRNFYLTGALELRGGTVGHPDRHGVPDMLAALSSDAALRQHRHPHRRPARLGPAADHRLDFSDTGERTAPASPTACSPTAPARGA